MQFSFANACLLALATATSVLAETVGFDVLTAPAMHEVLQAGSKFTIKWTPSEPAGPITLLLMQGETAITLKFADEPIAKSIDSTLGHFDWTVPSTAYKAYGIRLLLDSDSEGFFQSSNPFTIAGGSDKNDDDSKGEATLSIGEPTATSPSATSGTSTKTVQVSQISTAPTTSSTKASSTSTKAEPSTTSEEPKTTAESTTEAPTTIEPSSTLETSTTVPPTSTEAPTTPPSATPTGAAPRNAVVGSGILGAIAVAFALL